MIVSVSSELMILFCNQTLSLMVDLLKPKCVVKILDCCVQGQGHNEQLKIVMICTDIF